MQEEARAPSRNEPEGGECPGMGYEKDVKSTLRGGAGRCGSRNEDQRNARKTER